MLPPSPPRAERIPGLIVIIPAHNEDRFIGSVVLKARQYVDTVIVVDDGSTDRTAQVAEAAGAIVIQHTVNKGYGAAIDSALAKAREMEAEATVLIDADGQHKPEQIPSLVEPILAGRADMVVGSRYLHEDRDLPRNRMAAHRVVTAMTNIGSGIKLSDSQCGFRAFSRRAIAEATLSRQGMSAASEFQFLAHQHHWRVEEVPVTILYGGELKRSLLNHGLEVVNGIVLLVSRARPLLFFVVPGLLMLIAGAFFSGFVIIRYQQIQQVAIGRALAALLLIQIGVLAMFTGIILHSLRAMLLDLMNSPGRSKERNKE